MPQVGSLILVSFVHEQVLGSTFKRGRDAWPLHITLVPWFLAADEAQLVVQLQNKARELPARKITVGTQELFGRDGEVPVNVIVEQAPMKQLHEELMSSVHTVDGKLHEDIWTGEHYRAHITRREITEQGIHEGDPVIVGSFQLVRLLANDVCEVRQNFKLGTKP